MNIEDIKELERLECTACSGSGCYCAGECGACNGTGLEHSSYYILTLKDDLIHEQLKTIDQLKCCGNCKHALSMSQMGMGLSNVSQCQNCTNKSKWEVEEDL